MKGGQGDERVPPEKPDQVGVGGLSAGVGVLLPERIAEHSEHSSHRADVARAQHSDLEGGKGHGQIKQANRRAVKPPVKPQDFGRRHGTCGLLPSDPGKDSYVSVAGQAEVVDDLVRKRELWSKFAQAWFPGGPEDPDFALVRVRMTQADYWDVKQSKPVQLFKMAKAVLTGTRPSGMGERGSVKLE